VSEAQTILQFARKGAVKSFQKAIRSALASAANNFQIEGSNVYISKVLVDEGPKLKRYRPRARGRAYPIQKKTSHITLVLEELVPGIGKKEVKSFRGAQKAERRSQAQEKPKFHYERTPRRPRLEGIKNRIFRRKTV